MTEPQNLHADRSLTNVLNSLTSRGKMTDFQSETPREIKETSLPWNSSKFKILPDIKWDGHNSVEDDDVGPEGEEARENSTALKLIPW